MDMNQKTQMLMLNTLTPMFTTFSFPIAIFHCITFVNLNLYLKSFSNFIMPLFH